MASISVVAYGVCLFAFFRILQKSIRSPKAIANNFVKQARLFWYTILAPNGAEEHAERIDNFYRGQADLYDDSRKRLLRGRKTMLRLSAAQLLEARKGDKSRFVWVDIGGGTGWNIEAMNEFIPIHTFDAVYLVDICEPLLKIARQRFAARGWKNVHVIRQDAATFLLPEPGWTKRSGVFGSLSFVTFSYSLSMMPNFWSVLDRISKLLKPETGLISVADFYTSGRSMDTTPEIAGAERECSWLLRWFWQIWFEFDGVHLGPQRREYLEHRFSTVKCFNGRNQFFPVFVRIPYYVWLGTTKALNVESDASMSSPTHTNPSNPSSTSLVVSNGARRWRQPYHIRPEHKSMKTFMYSFTWEDPFEDMEFLQAGPEDSLLTITSAGDNALHYLTEAKPKVIHCVDMNPCQGHLFELKLAAISSLTYEQFFTLFGLGRCASFHQTLDGKLSSLLSTPCYQFWKARSKVFSTPSSLYQHGYSGVALRIFRTLCFVFGLREHVKAFCSADTIEEQEKIWKETLRPVVLNPLVLAVLDNPVFCWRALGVPRNQRKVLLEEGTAYDYVKDTLDPIASYKLLKDGAYHYLLPLIGRYTPASCPLYLKRCSFETLRSKDCSLLNAIQIHTDSISNVLKSMSPDSLTRAIVMDHLDWFSEGSPDVLEEVLYLKRALRKGGFVMFRSAARRPWYVEMFAANGFEVVCLKCRQPGSKLALDGVNMYASLWKAVNKKE